MNYRQITFAVAIAIVLAAGTVGGKSLYDVMERRAATVESLSIQREAEELLSALKDAETAVRGFIITGVNDYLEPYRTASSRAHLALGQLDDLAGTPSEHRPAIERLGQVVSQQLVFAEERIAARQRGGFTVAADRTTLDKGKLSMDEIRALVASITLGEQLMLSARQDQLDHKIRQTIYILAIGLVVSAGWICVVFYLVNREVGLRRNAEIRAAGLNRRLMDLNASLERRVADRTRDLGAANDRLQAEIGKRERIGEDLRQSTEMLEALVESTPHAVVSLDANRIVRVWNRAAATIFGYTAKDVIGRPFPLVPDEGRDAFDRDFAEVMSGGRLTGVEIKSRHKDGRLIDVRYSGAPLSDERRCPRGAVYALEDVTNEKVYARQLEHAQRMEAVGQLTGGIAHDFNNILTVVIGNLDLLRERLEEDGEALDLSDLALTGALKGAELTRQLLAFSRQQKLEPRTVDVNDLVSGMVRLLERALGERIEISLHLDDGLWPVLADPAQIESAVMNLSINARDAMPEGGALTIETGRAHLDDAYAAENAEVSPGDYAMIAVSDTGCGIAPEIVARVVEPFFTTKGTNKGTGLGLSMVYGFAKQSGGHLKIYSEAGRGTTVKLFLPREECGDARPETEKPVEVRPACDVGVLVVEDREDVRRTAARQLQELGCRVVEAASPQEALVALGKPDEIQLLFTDIVLPGNMTGVELARKAVVIRPDIRVLYTSGFAAGAVGRAGLEPGAHFLGKPYLKRDLARLVSEALDGP